MALISWNTIGKCRGVLCHFLFHLVLTIWFISLGCKYKISTNTMNDFSVKPSWSSFTICLDFNSCYSCWWQCRIESFQIHLQVKKKIVCVETFIIFLFSTDLHAILEDLFWQISSNRRTLKSFAQF